MLVDLGVQSFEVLRERNAFYIDKTLFIKEWREYGSSVTLITRPRRFGKTLNMTMLECFFSNKYAGRGDLFEGLSIWDDEMYRQIQGTFPVIFLSFASVNKNMSDETAETALNSLCIYLEKYYGKKVIVILDEYDTPMQEAWLAGNWEEAVAFFRGFLNAVFKTNPCMYRGIITGITRVSKESVFSDLNNLDVITTTSDEFMNRIALQSFSSFDIANSTFLEDSPERFYHGFVLGMIVDLEGRFVITSNRESGFGRYDIMLRPADKERDNAYIIEFKVHRPKKEKTLEETVANALAQIEEKRYEVELLADGVKQERIRKYGFAFEGKRCLIG